MRDESQTIQVIGEPVHYDSCAADRVPRDDRCLVIGVLDE